MSPQAHETSFLDEFIRAPGADPVAVVNGQALAWAKSVQPAQLTSGELLSLEDGGGWALVIGCGC